MKNTLGLYRKKFQQARSPKEILFLYKKVLANFSDRYKNTLYDWEAKRLPDVINRRNFLNANCKGKILDLGCGDGMFDLRLAESGHEVLGLDMLDKRIKLAKKMSNEKCTFVSGLIEESEIPPNSFDTTIISHVLEHSFNPDQIISIAVGATRKHGKIIVILPPSIGNDPTHLRYISSSEIKKKLRKFGKVSNKIIVGPKSNAYVCDIL